MAIAGLIVTLLGFVIAFMSLGLTQSVNARMIMVLVGIIVSFGGILGLINPAFQKNADWRK
jgi:hypothetical protein